MFSNQLDKFEVLSACNADTRIDLSLCEGVGEVVDLADTETCKGACGCSRCADKER